MASKTRIPKPARILTASVLLAVLVAVLVAALVALTTSAAASVSVVSAVGVGVGDVSVQHLSGIYPPEWNLSTV